MNRLLCRSCGTTFKQEHPRQKNCSRRCTVRLADAARRDRKNGRATMKRNPDQDLRCPCGTRDPLHYHPGVGVRCMACDRRRQRNGLCSACGRALYKSRPCECGRGTYERLL